MLGHLEDKIDFFFKHSILHIIIMWVIFTSRKAGQHVYCISTGWGRVTFSFYRNLGSIGTGTMELWKIWTTKTDFSGNPIGFWWFFPMVLGSGHFYQHKQVGLDNFWSLNKNSLIYFFNQPSSLYVMFFNQMTLVMIRWRSVHEKFLPIINKKWSIKWRTGIAVASAFESPWNCWLHLFLHLHLPVLVYQERTVQTVRNTLHLLLVDSCSAYVIDHFRCIQQMCSQHTTGWSRLFWWASHEPKRLSILLPTRPQLRRKLSI